MAVPAVKIHDLAAQIIIHIHAGQRERRFLRERRRVYPRQKDELRLGAVLRPFLREREHAAIGQDLISLHVVAVYVALHPVHDLFRRAGLGYVAVNLAVVVVEEIVNVVAGLDVIGKRRKLDRLSPVLLHRVKHLDAVRFAVGEQADLIGAVLHQLAAVVVVERGDLVSVLIPDKDLLPVARVDIAVGIDDKIVQIEAAAVFILLRDVGGQLDQCGGAGAALVVVVLVFDRRVETPGQIEAVGVHLLIEPDGVVAARAHLLRIGVALPALGHLGLFRQRDLHALLRGQVHAEQLVFIVVVFVALAGGLVHIGLLADRHVAHEPEAAADAVGLNVVHLHRQVDVLRLIGVFRGDRVGLHALELRARPGGASALLLAARLGLHIRLAGLRAAAAGKAARQHRDQQHDCQNALFHIHSPLHASQHVSRVGSPDTCACFLILPLS